MSVFGGCLRVSVAPTCPEVLVKLVNGRRPPVGEAWTQTGASAASASTPAAAAASSGAEPNPAAAAGESGSFPSPMRRRTQPAPGQQASPSPPAALVPERPATDERRAGDSGAPAGRTAPTQQQTNGGRGTAAAATGARPQSVGRPAGTGGGGGVEELLADAGRYRELLGYLLNMHCMHTHG